ncbi:GNAT family N-acetyltransferase [Actinokineospora sp.]|uniref:GNAT family N-acetyltransferase n=1 Tax=Actinokineospora sp. TaxID=1872133 RepID=UPI003D6B95B2
MANDDYSIRPLTGDDLPEFSALLAKAFLSDDNVDSMVESERLVFEPERSLAVVAEGRFAGVGQILTRSVCVPGRGQTPVAAVTSVGVATDHRRRGVLTRLMRAQLHGLHESGAEPIAALWASEAAIYGRFGYGGATDFVSYEITAKTPFRPGVDLGVDRVRELPREEVLPVIRPLYDRYAATRVGMLGRGDGHWAYHLLDSEQRRAGASRLRFAVHPDGYAAYRVKSAWTERGPDGRVSVRELVANTPQAYAALVRHLLDVDLIGWVDYNAGVDDPLPLLLQTPRAAGCSRYDGMFVRLVDIDRALPTRSYASAVDVVLEVADEFCPWNAGRWRFTVDAGGAAEVTRSTDEPDVSTSTTDLAAAFLGGTRVATLAAAGRVREHTPGAVAALSAAFLGEREPVCLEVF